MIVFIFVISLTYTSIDDKFVFNKRVDAPNFYGNFFGNLTGNVSGNNLGDIDFGSINSIGINVIEFILQAITIDLGLINSPGSFNIDLGNITI